MEPNNKVTWRRQLTILSLVGAAEKGAKNIRFKLAAVVGQVLAIPTHLASIVREPYIIATPFLLAARQ